MFKPDTVTEILHWHDIMILFIVVLLVYIRKGSSTASTADKSEKQCNCCWLMLPLWWMSVYWYYYSSFDWRDYSFFSIFLFNGIELTRTIRRSFKNRQNLHRKTSEVSFFTVWIKAGWSMTKSCETVWAEPKPNLRPEKNVITYMW